MLERRLAQLLIVLTLVVAAERGGHGEEFEQAPIAYSRSQPSNRVSRLLDQFASGEQQLAHDEQFGYLRSLLAKLEVPVSSQMLVFSKTSLQRNHISPRTPRALYFSDDVYVGYCQN